MLLSIGLLGLLIEMQTLHGIAGAIGATAFALFFGTHVYAGFPNSLVDRLGDRRPARDPLGAARPAGARGRRDPRAGRARRSAIVLAFGLPFVFVAAQSLAIAIVLTVVGFWFAARLFPQNAFMHRLAFSGGARPRLRRRAPIGSALLGHAGIATSYLRPAGVAAIDGQRVDVLTEGEFVAAGTPIVVTRVEGARIFVRPGV